MKKTVVFLAIPILLVAAASAEEKPLPRNYAPEETETHLGELTMLTDGGENAEAYFSFDGRSLSLQSTHGDWACDQIFTMPIEGGEMQLVSTGTGRTTCAHWMPDGKSVLYSSTDLADAECPPTPDMSRGYVWALYPTYDIFVVDTTTGERTQLTDEWGYDAEATINPQGDRIVFTSDRSGDLEIYTMDLDGGNVVQLTEEIGYDGGPFFSPDGTRIVYRAHHPTEEAAVADYKALLADHMIRPSQLEIFVMDVDGKNKRQVTELGSATFAPYFHPGGEKIIFSSNYPDKGREFDLWMIDVDGSDLEQITHSPGFDGFPMWAPDGRTFVFASNRHNSQQGETNIFITQWKD